MAQRDSIHINEFVHKNPIPNASRIANIVVSGAIMGRDPETDGGFSWEKTDLVDDLKAAFA